MVDKEKYPILSIIERMIEDSNIYGMKIKEISMTQAQLNLLRKEARDLVTYDCEASEQTTVWGIKITVKEETFHVNHSI